MLATPAERIRISATFNHDERRWCSDVSIMAMVSSVRLAIMDHHMLGLLAPGANHTGRMFAQPPDTERLIGVSRA